MSAKSARSARSGRFVSRAHSDPTEAPQKVPTRQHSKHIPPTITQAIPPLPSFSLSQAAYHVAVPSPLLSNIASPVFTANGDSFVHTTDPVGRPPSKIFLESNGGFHQTVNGAVTKLKLRDDDIAAISHASAAAFDAALTREITPTSKEKDKRVLRSQGGSFRPKSSLARFFPDFEDVVFGSSREPDFLTVDSTLFIVDKKLVKALSERRNKSKSPRIEKEMMQDIQAPIEPQQAQPTAPKSRANILESWPTVDTTALEIEAQKYSSDPLSENVFLKAHKRGERKEKQLRNIEKEHALHEKSDLERVLAELKGPDWLKAMGIGGITETEKKAFEPHRDQYLMRVRALLNKFSAWKEQERKLKIRREEALAAREDAEEDEDEEEVERNHVSKHLDASGRRLLLETNSTKRTKPKIKLKLPKLALPEPEPDKVFESFYSKPYLRAAALSNHRRGRSINAFGLPLPDMEIKEFTLPHDFVTEEIILANARKRRRLKRESNVSEDN